MGPIFLAHLTVRCWGDTLCLETRGGAKESQQLSCSVWSRERHGCSLCLLDRHTCVHVCSAVSDSLQCYGLQPTRLLCPCGFSRQECWSELPCPPPGDLPNPGIEPVSPVSPALAGRFFTIALPGKPQKIGKC